jgi:hypothetical protein
MNGPDPALTARMLQMLGKPYKTAAEQAELR